MVQFVKLRPLVPIIVLFSLSLIFLLTRPRMTTIPRQPHSCSDDKDKSDYKYILTWTPDTPNVKLMGWSFPELDGFKKAGCAEYRCYLTNNRSYLGRLQQIREGLLPLSNIQKIFPELLTSSRISTLSTFQVVPLMTLKSSMRLYSTRETFL